MIIFLKLIIEESVVCDKFIVVDVVEFLLIPFIGVEEVDD